MQITEYDELPLARYEAAMKALAEAHSVDEVADILDKAKATAAAAKIAKNKSLEYMAKEIVLRAERKAGDLLAEMPKGVNRFSGSTLQPLSISKSESSRWQRVATVPDEVFDSYIAETKAAGRDLTSAGVRKLAKQEPAKQHSYDVGREYCTEDDIQALADTVEAGDRPAFGTVYADPPWRYGNQGTRGATGDHYVGMTVEEICALPIATLAAEESHLHLWTTNAFLFDAQRVMESWGYTYKSCYIWVKPQIGMGNYWRVSHEFLLLGVKGSLTFADNSLRSWGEFKRSQHSAKPERIRDLIHLASPGPRLELFARRAVEGWTCWGNEIRRDVFAA